MDSKYIELQTERIGGKPISQVFNMDCMDGLKQIPDKFFDLSLVDPPYGIGYDGVRQSTGSHGGRKAHAFKGWDNSAPSEQYFSELRRVSKNQIVWGGNFFGLTGGYICWDKNGTAFGEAELAYCSMQKSVSVFEFTWNGMIQQDMKNKENRIHPTQKPIKLYEWTLGKYAKPGDKILDTHMGSQSSRIAAFLMGFDYYGWEIDAEYFEKGNKRFKDITSQQQLFRA